MTQNHTIKESTADRLFKATKDMLVTWGGVIQKEHEETAKRAELIKNTSTASTILSRLKNGTRAQPKDWKPTSEKTIGRQTYALKAFPEFIVANVQALYQNGAEWSKIMSPRVRKKACLGFPEKELGLHQHAVVINTKAGHIVDLFVIPTTGLTFNEQSQIIARIWLREIFQWMHRGTITPSSMAMAARTTGHCISESCIHIILTRTMPPRCSTKMVSMTCSNADLRFTTGF
jgi:hypothetical protein